MDENTSQPAPAASGAVVRKKRLSSGFELLGALFMLGVVLQHIISGVTQAQALGTRRFAVIVGLLAFIVVIAGDLNLRWRRFFSSNRFAVPLLFTLTALSVIGTLILQGQSEAVLASSYGAAALAVIRGLFLNDMFHGFGFAIVLGMGAGGLATVIIRRPRLGVRRFGSLLAHLGLVVTLAGACLGSVWGIKGRIDLHAGEATENFNSAGPDGHMQQRPLGFKLSLDEFKIEKYEPDFRLTVFDISGKKEKRLAGTDPAAPDSELLAGYGLKLLDYWPDHFKRDVVEQPKPGAETSGKPAAALLGLAGDDDRWIFDDRRASGGRVELGGKRLAFFWDAERADKYAADIAEKSSNPPHVIIAGKQRLSLETGQKVKLPGSDHSLEIKRALLDFVLDPSSNQPQNRSSRPDNPAVEVIVRDAAGKQIASGWLFAKFPDFHGQGQGALGGLRYEYSGAKGRMIDAILIGEKPEMALFSDGKISSRVPVEIGKELAIGKTKLVVKTLWQYAIHRVEDGTRSDRENNPMARVEIKGRKKPLDVTPQSPVRLSGNRALLLGPKGGEMVRDYLSRVSVYQGDRKVLSRIIEVNDPLSYGGYSIYQADYRPEDPTYSGFEVVSDPGLWIVYLGILLNLAGVFWAMFLPNILKRRHRAAGSGGAK
jgi:hypothetical protein